MSSQPHYLQSGLSARQFDRGARKAAPLSSIGREKTGPVPFVQTIDEYIEAFHSMSGLSRQHMTANIASAFDDAIRALLSKFGATCKVEMHVVGTVLWGVPESL
jgi:hypothetical protein